MESRLKRRETYAGTWDEDHVKALLHFPRFPAHLIQQEPWQSWIGQRGGLKSVLSYLRAYPLSPSHQRIFDVVLSNPEATADMYASRLNISRATYFYQLRQLISALTLALNHWDLAPASVEPVVRTSLPVPLTTLIGAEASLHVLSHMLIRDDVHLVTLLGPGGIGKTRLALELAHRFQGESCFVDLSWLTDPSGVAAAIAQSLGTNDSRQSTLCSWFFGREFLLVLDNFEQILPAASLITSFLTAVPRLKVIVTSRVALNVYGEHEFVVPPLAMSDIETVKNQQLWAQSPAVALFVQRAQAVNPNFVMNSENADAVAELCLRTEGIPLVIELAAFQMKYYSPRVILAHLGKDRLNFLSRVPKRMPPHQQTLRIMLDWSYNLLPPDLQRLFCRLSMFQESFTVSEAETQPLGDAIQAGILTLVDHSMLEQRVASDGETHFHMSTLIREYAFEKLSLTGA
jgi:predicted ATPase